MKWEERILRHNKTMLRQKMEKQRDKSRQVSRDTSFYVMTNISENDKIKAGNMSRHFKSMSRHKVQKSSSQGKKVMSQQRSFILRQPQHNVKKELCRNIEFYCHDTMKR